MPLEIQSEAQVYSYSFSNSTGYCGECSSTKIRSFSSRERNKVPNFTEEWMGPRFGLNGRGEEKTY